MQKLYSTRIKKGWRGYNCGKLMDLNWYKMCSQIIQYHEQITIYNQCEIALKNGQSTNIRASKQTIEYVNCVHDNQTLMPQKYNLISFNKDRKGH